MRPFSGVGCVYRLGFRYRATIDKDVARTPRRNSGVRPEERLRADHQVRRGGEQSVRVPAGRVFGVRAARGTLCLSDVHCARLLYVVVRGMGFPRSLGACLGFANL